MRNITSRRKSLDPRGGRFYRSDQVNFAKKGIPALFIGPGTRYVEPLDFDAEAYRREHYHQVSDEVNEYWDLAGAERDIQVRDSPPRRSPLSECSRGACRHS